MSEAAGSAATASVPLSCLDWAATHLCPVLPPSIEVWFFISCSSCIAYSSRSQMNFFAVYSWFPSQLWFGPEKDEQSFYYLRLFFSLCYYYFCFFLEVWFYFIWVWFWHYNKCLELFLYVTVGNIVSKLIYNFFWKC